ncbi:MAG TPA: alpha-D-ribose 1-methylphosphonate 5-triphosphate diphosphatase [Hypericibacter adhaerens]|uniref:alpha-D-ribose 1-methylphosphonate 5-triphosphate diphosphatase n=1 Tax=Hypericibacter adhaerens TaxID=2602016 RepID=UPI002B883665|nr:alpha-D-ribose 1-methylphosphonate 5-triphosphate diphosphatase [Hypericibacter adhaerens]HWA46326.1 alpha-D-ribose 1-methylphosphonate 5-triphosphate diphosphatase [Hypericibacter adhaerens]
MSTETILTRARIVLPDEILDGTLLVRDGRIAEIETGQTRLQSAVDCQGDYLIPGMVELHTDNLDKHIAPRPRVHWPARSAVVAHDAQIATAGITTVFDSVAIGDIHRESDRIETLTAMAEGLEECQREGMLRVEHFLHLRCEISHGDLPGHLARLAGHPCLKLVSLMDHTPGQRQFATLAQYAAYYQGKYQLSDAELDSFVQRCLDDRARHGDANRAAVIELVRERGIKLASHDDATVEHAEEAAEAGAVVAEFPTTRVAALALRERGIGILSGAPNVVRGGSHSGNISAIDLARDGLVDILSSDYVPASLLPAAFRLVQELGYSLPAAIRMVATRPADAMGLTDRGRIAPGLRADLVRVAERGGLPLVRAVWHRGERVA